MPELPEVETITQGVKPYLLNQSIKEMRLYQSKLRWPIAQDLPERLKKQSIKAVWRRAKYIIIEFKIGFVLIHLGMSGTLSLIKTDLPRKKHDHWEWVLSNGEIIRYHDPRRFGCLLFTQNLQDHPLLGHLAPEPLSADFNSEYLYQRLQASKMSLKNFLMNQKYVVGVGNIYANEALFMSRLHPLKMTRSLSFEQAQALYTAIVEVLQKAILKGGTTLKDFAHIDKKPGYFQQKLLVYGKKAKACPICQQAIEHCIISNRSSYFCPNCQIS